MSLHDIIDNRGESLSDHINRVLTTSEMAKFAVGYFFLSGFEALADRLDGLKELKLLIGNTSTRETIEQMAEGYRRLDLVKQAAEQQQYRRRADVKRMVDAVGEEVQLNAELMEQTDQAEKTIRTLVRMIEEKRLIVRVYTKGRLHAKAYLFDYGKVYDLIGQPVAREENGLAIVGSSNLTLAGISHNTELNVVVHGNANHAVLVDWFNRLWEESEDFNETLMRELNASWALNPVTPYDIYMKTLYALVKDRLDGDAPTQVLVDTEIESRLADFQKVAVRVVNQMINEHDGAFVADVVGLGKSYIGAAIIKRQEQQNGARPLVICPAPLVEMWERYSEVYQLNAAVVSMGLLGSEEKAAHLLDPINGFYKDRDFVLLDESHNFRNSSSGRYEAVQKFLAGGRRRCCLLTATPRNKSAWDVYNQLRLFHPSDKTELPINPPDLRLYFREVEAHTKSLQDLLRHVLYRRTRRDVLRYYGFDSQTHKPVDPKDFEPYVRGERKAYVMVANKPQYFPKRQLQTIEYSIENTYQGLYQRLRDYMGRNRVAGQQASANELTYARYGLGNYIRDEYATKETYHTLQTSGSNLRGLVRVLLFKRFESSVHAFQQSLKKLLRIHEAFVSAMREGFIPAGEDAQRILYELEDVAEEDFLDDLKEVSKKYQLAAFDEERLKTDLEHDINILKKMLELVEPISPAKDAKLIELKARLGSAPLNKGKCLIFTQFADTARYLFDNLNPGGTRQDIEVAYSGHKNKMKLVRRFSPNSNQDLAPISEPELNTVIATDVFSEGLNLQDCDKIMNYDLHWNPVRLIQRFGRIDRIGSEHETIFGFNFLPETAMDQQLGLRQTLRNRIREIHETIGEDAKILDDTEEVNERAMYAIYEDQNSAILDEEEDEVAGLVNLNEAEEMLRKLKLENPAEYKRIVEMSDGVRSAKDSSTGGIYVFCEASYPDRPEVRGYQQLYHVSASGEIQTREIPRILRLIASTPETPTRHLPSNFNESVTRARRLFAEEVKHRESELKHTVPLSPAQRYLLRELKVLFVATTDEEQKGQVNLLEQIVRMPPTQAVAREFNALRRAGTQGPLLKERLAILVQRHGLSQREMRENHALEKPQVKIVCSEALL